MNSSIGQSLSGNFEALCQNAHILFEGKAKTWFWRHHRSVTPLDWFSLCSELKRTFKDYRTDFDVRELIRNRKQKEKESFDQYLDEIMVLTDRLRAPLSEEELVETITRNLQPNVRLGLLHLDISSLSQLRKEVRKLENFSEQVQKNVVESRSSQPRRFISEIETALNSVSVNCIDEISNPNTINFPHRVDGKEIRCWNCDDIGHKYQDCIKQRRVFCYGCGTVAIFKPHCQKCSSSENSGRDASNNIRRHPNSNPPNNRSS